MPQHYAQIATMSTIHLHKKGCQKFGKKAENLTA